MAESGCGFPAQTYFTPVCGWRARVWVDDPYTVSIPIPANVIDFGS